MGPRHYVEAILNGSQSYRLTFAKVVIFKGNTQIACLDEENTEGRNAGTVIFKDSRYSFFGDSIRLAFRCLTDIQKYGALLNFDDSDYITIDSNRWFEVAVFPQIVIMNCIEDGNIDSISLIADDEAMLTLQIRSGEYDILAVDPIFQDLMVK